MTDEEYHKRINENAAHYFSLDKNDNTVTTERFIYKSKLLTDIFKFYMQKENKGGKSDQEKTLDCGEEIVKAFNYYDDHNKQAADFFYYIQKVINNKRIELEFTENIDRYTSTSAPVKLSKYIVSLLRSKNVPVTYNTFLKFGTEILNKKQEKIDDAWNYYDGRNNASLDTPIGQDSETTLADICEDRNSEIDLERYLLNTKTKTDKVLHIIDECFDTQRKDVDKSYLSAVYTCHIAQELIDINAKYGNISNYNFVDKKRFEKYCSDPSQIQKLKDVADEFHKDVTDASRIIKRFQDKIKSKLESEGIDLENTFSQ
jgi:hypothetical protein